MGPPACIMGSHSCLRTFGIQGSWKHIRLDSHSEHAEATCRIDLRSPGCLATRGPSAGKTCGHMCIQLWPRPATSCVSSFLIGPSSTNKAVSSLHVFLSLIRQTYQDMMLISPAYALTSTMSWYTILQSDSYFLH